MNSSNNRLRYNFPSDQQFDENTMVALSHLNIYFSWYNITAKNNNNFFQYRFWNLAGELEKFKLEMIMQDVFRKMMDEAKTQMEGIQIVKDIPQGLKK